MPDATDLVKAIKTAALDAMEAGKPSDVMFGKVTSVSPLQISVEQKMVLGKAQLVLSRNVTNFQTQITMSSKSGWETDTSTHNHVIHDTYTDGGTSEDHTHKHSINKTASITVHNGLVVGDEVILVRQQGGQKFIVLDRVGS